MRAFWRYRPRHQWVAGVMAVMMPVGIVVAFYYDGQTRLVPSRTIIYVDSWPAARTDAEIKAKQRTDLRERRARELRRQREFQRLDESLNRLGI